MFVDLDAERVRKVPRAGEGPGEILVCIRQWTAVRQHAGGNGSALQGGAGGLVERNIPVGGCGPFEGIRSCSRPGHANLPPSAQLLS